MRGNRPETLRDPIKSFNMYLENLTYPSVESQEKAASNIDRALQKITKNQGQELLTNMSQIYERQNTDFRHPNNHY